MATQYKRRRRRTLTRQWPGDDNGGEYGQTSSSDHDAVPLSGEAAQDVSGGVAGAGDPKVNSLTVDSDTNIGRNARGQFTRGNPGGPGRGNSRSASTRQGRAKRGVGDLLEGMVGVLDDVGADKFGKALLKKSPASFGQVLMNLSKLEAEKLSHQDTVVNVVCAFPGVHAAESDFARFREVEVLERTQRDLARAEWQIGQLREQLAERPNTPAPADTGPVEVQPPLFPAKQDGSGVALAVANRDGWEPVAW